MKIQKSLLWALAFAFAGISQAAASDWTYEFEPYLLASSIEGDAGIGRVQQAPVDVSFGDILETLDAGIMAVFRGRRDDGWGFDLDYGFMDLRSDISGPRGGVASTRTRQGVLEALVTRRSRTNDALEYFAGLRWWDNDIDVMIDPALLPANPAVSAKDDWIDIVFGVERTTEFRDNWDFVLRGDIGGFGIESDWTGSLSVGFRHTINERLDLNLKYKALWVDYESGSRGQPGYFAYDTVTHGPLVGLVIKF